MSSVRIQVRNAVESDREGISNVVVSAFGPEEGAEINGLVSELLADSTAKPLLSLVATLPEQIVGHILFTNAAIRNHQRNVSSVERSTLPVRIGVVVV